LSHALRLLQPLLLFVPTLSPRGSPVRTAVPSCHNRVLTLRLFALRLSIAAHGDGCTAAACSLQAERKEKGEALGKRKRSGNATVNEIVSPPFTLLSSPSCLLCSQGNEQRARPRAAATAKGKRTTPVGQRERNDEHGSRDGGKHTLATRTCPSPSPPPLPSPRLLPPPRLLLLFPLGSLCCGRLSAHKDARARPTACRLDFRSVYCKNYEESKQTEGMTSKRSIGATNVAKKIEN
jgi:hypothetical protein